MEWNQDSGETIHSQVKVCILLNVNIYIKHFSPFQIIQTIIVYR